MSSKINITKKLFILTTIMFAIFIGATLVIQSLFFERFYIDKKQRDLKDYIEQFKADYDNTVDVESINLLMEEYEENYNIKIAVADSINMQDVITIPPKKREDTSKIRQLTEFMKFWRQDEYDASQLTSGKKSVIIMTRKDTSGAATIVGVSINKSGELIFAISSLQPVSEAVSVIKQLYLYFSIGAVFFTIILALINSRMIAKPLVKINRVATKMAKLDFTEKCEVKSNDEIGNVAASLNFLSENLNSALNSLKDANSKLEEDIERERNLEKMRREFVASVSHELKTPISLIDGYSVGLKDNIFEGEDKDYYLDIIIDETRKMSHLVSDMLDLSYLESGSFKLSREEFDISKLIKVTIRKYETIIDEKEVKVQLKLLNGVEIYADWDRMEQVITNFITNALRHVNEGGTIYIVMNDKGDNIAIEIENTGSTIPEGDLEKIWDKFYKVDKSRNRKFGGTGIGLSIVKNILQLHGYDFGTENTDRGVKFYFIIPKVKNDDIGSKES